MHSGDEESGGYREQNSGAERRGDDKRDSQGQDQGDGAPGGGGSGGSGDGDDEWNRRHNSHRSGEIPDDEEVDTEDNKKDDKEDEDGEEEENKEKSSKKQKKRDEDDGEEEQEKTKKRNKKKTQEKSQKDKNDQDNQDDEGHDVDDDQDHDDEISQPKKTKKGDQIDSEEENSHFPNNEDKKIENDKEGQEEAEKEDQQEEEEQDDQDEVEEEESPKKLIDIKSRLKAAKKARGEETESEKQQDEGEDEDDNYSESGEGLEEDEDLNEEENHEDCDNEELDSKILPEENDEDQKEGDEKDVDKKKSPDSSLPKREDPQNYEDEEVPRRSVRSPRRQLQKLDIKDKNEGEGKQEDEEGQSEGEEGGEEEDGQDEEKDQDQDAIDENSEQTESEDPKAKLIISPSNLKRAKKKNSKLRPLPVEVLREQDRKRAQEAKRGKKAEQKKKRKPRKAQKSDKQSNKSLEKGQEEGKEEEDSQISQDQTVDQIPPIPNKRGGPEPTQCIQEIPPDPSQTVNKDASDGIADNMFDFYDLDKDGELTPTESNLIIQELLQEPRHIDIKSLNRYLKQNGAKNPPNLTKEEFREVFNSHICGRDLADDDEEEDESLIADDNNNEEENDADDNAAEGEQQNEESQDLDVENQEKNDSFNKTSPQKTLVINPSAMDMSEVDYDEEKDDQDDESQENLNQPKKTKKIKLTPEPSDEEESQGVDQNRLMISDEEIQTLLKKYGDGESQKPLMRDEDQDPKERDHQPTAAWKEEPDNGGEGDLNIQEDQQDEGGNQNPSPESVPQPRPSQQAYNQPILQISPQPQPQPQLNVGHNQGSKKYDRPLPGYEKGEKMISPYRPEPSLYNTSPHKSQMCDEERTPYVNRDKRNDYEPIKPQAKDYQSSGDQRRIKIRKPQGREGKEVPQNGYSQSGTLPRPMQPSGSQNQRQGYYQSQNQLPNRPPSRQPQYSNTSTNYRRYDQPIVIDPKRPTSHQSRHQTQYEEPTRDDDVLQKTIQCMLENGQSNQRINAELRRAEQNFRRFDTNNNGALDRNEAQNLIQYTYQNVLNRVYQANHQDVSSFLNQMDKTQDGRVGLKEYQNFVLQALNNRRI